MATVAESLFGVTPESLQRQRQQQLRQEAMDFASISDPFQQANFAIYQGAGNLARGVGGMLGAQDPELMRVRQRQELLQGVNPADPASLREAAQRAMEANDFQAAQLFSDRALSAETSQAKLASEQALTNQRNRERAAADPLQQLIRTGKYTTASVAKYQTTGNVADLELNKETTKSASELGKLIAERDALDPVKNASEIKAYNDKIKKLTTGKSLGEEIAAGLSPTLSAISKQQSEKAGAAGGTAVGKQSAEVQGKYDALTSLKEALDVVDRGIYAGGYGPMQEAMAKYSGGVIGNKNRLVNTEEFRSLIGNVVIPRLQDFGGNDSVEELKYLRSVLAGETTLEPTAIKRILTAAERKIQAGVKRLETQQQAIVEGRPLPVGALPQQGATPRATRRFNLSTGQFEVIGGQ
jgi:hypothetical protein